MDIIITELDPEATFPHCDARVLHAPGECEYCDKHPQWQKLREVWGINFTGKTEPGKTKCPAELSRPIEVINRWHGNQPRPSPNGEILP